MFEILNVEVYFSLLGVQGDREVHMTQSNDIFFCLNHFLEILRVKLEMPKLFLLGGANRDVQNSPMSLSARVAIANLRLIFPQTFL